MREFSSGRLFLPQYVRPRQILRIDAGIGEIFHHVSRRNHTIRWKIFPNPTFSVRIYCEWTAPFGGQWWVDESDPANRVRRPRIEGYLEKPTFPKLNTSFKNKGNSIYEACMKEKRVIRNSLPFWPFRCPWLASTEPVQESNCPDSQNEPELLVLEIIVVKVANLGNVHTQVAMNSRTANANEHAEIPRGPPKNKNSTSSICNGKYLGVFAWQSAQYLFSSSLSMSRRIPWKINK